MEKDSSEIAKLTERIAKDPKSKLFVPLAEEYKKIGDIATAVRILTEGLKNNPGYVTARSFLGRLLMDSGDLVGAQKELEEVIKAIPDNLLAQRKLGDLHVILGNSDEALKRYKAALALNPGDKEVTSLVTDLEAGKDVSARIPRPKTVATAEKTLKPVPPVQTPKKPVTADVAAQTKPVPQPSMPVRQPAAVPAAPPQIQKAEPVPQPSTPAEPAAVQKKTSPELKSPELQTTPSGQDKFEQKPTRESSTKAPVLSDDVMLDVAGERASAPASTGQGEELVSGRGHAPVEDEPEAESIEEIVELEPLERLAAEAAAQHVSRVSPAPGGATGPVAVPPGEFDLSESLSEPSPFGEEPAREWTPPEDVHPEPAAEQVVGDATDDINTDTLAELYISQSFYEKAIEIYERMLNERPGTAALEQKLQKLRALAASADKDTAPIAATPETAPSETGARRQEVASPSVTSARAKQPEPVQARPAMSASSPAAAVEAPTVAQMPQRSAAPVGRARPASPQDDTLKAMQKALEGAERQGAGQGADEVTGTPAVPPVATVRRKETIDRLENWLKNVMKEKPE